MPLGSAQTGTAPSATLPSLRRSRARPEPERRWGSTPARGPEPSGRGKPIANPNKNLRWKAREQPPMPAPLPLTAGR